MVVSKQVQHAVRYQEAQLPLEGVAVINRLKGAALQANDNIAQEHRLAFRQGGQFLALQLRKRQHIGRLVQTPVVPVQVRNLRIINKRNGDFGVTQFRPARQFQRPLGDSLRQALLRLRQRYLLLIVGDPHRK